MDPAYLDALWQWLATPVALYALLAFALFAATRLQALWGRAGAVLLALAGVALVVLLWLRPGLGEGWLALGGPWPALVTIVVAAGVWSLLDDERRRRLAGGPKTTPFFPARGSSWVGLGNRELVASGLAVVLAGALAFWAGPPLPELEVAVSGSGLDGVDGTEIGAPEIGTPDTDGAGTDDAAVEVPGPVAADGPFFLAPFLFWRSVLGPTAGSALPLLVLVLALALPWLDPEDPEDGGRHRLVMVVAGTVLGLFLVPMLLWWLGVPLAEGRGLARRVWEDWLGRPAPRGLLLRELPGLCLLAVYFLVPTLVLPRWRASRGLLRAYRRRLGGGRFVLAMVSLALLLLPVFLLLSRELLGLGPWLDWGEWGIRL